MSVQTFDNSSMTNPSGSAAAGSFFKLLPAILIVALVAIARVWIFFGDPSIGVIMFSLMIAPLVGLVAMLVWWWFFSGFSLVGRQLALGALALDVVLVVFVAHPTFRGMGTVPLVIPIMLACWVAWLLLSLVFPVGVRLAGVLVILLASGGVACAARLDGIRGGFSSDVSWRWSPTAEDRMMASLKASPQQAKNEKASDPAGNIPAVADLALQPGDWPSFRGSMRDSRLTGVRIKTNWDQTPPKELWRHLIGPGWSSFAVVGDHVFTQEQRGNDEYVVCYDGQNGKEIWSHYNAERFEETMAGPGPRATPTFDAGRLYVLGAKGTLDCLQAATGKLIWSHNIIADTGAKLPMWGFASSPLVSHGLVSVYAGGPNKKAVVAYHADSGELAWAAGDGMLSYSSPQLATIDGIEQILISTNLGLSSIEPSAGKVLWQYDWSVGEIARIVQPTIVGDHDLLLGAAMGIGTRRISVGHRGDSWQPEKAWETKKIKPYYNDLVVVGDYIYGFDGSAFLCLSLKDQTSRWRVSDYGAGQVLLLADQNLLLILSETGEVALVKAQPEKREEIGRFKALEGKTWNHPVIAHGKLFVRNGEEVACYELPME
jgi:outer membrane protein assembly factor BamB